MLFAAEAIPKITADARITVRIRSPICYFSTIYFWDGDKNYFADRKLSRCRDGMRW